MLRYSAPRIVAQHNAIRAIQGDMSDTKAAPVFPDNLGEHETAVAGYAADE